MTRAEAAEHHGSEPSAGSGPTSEPSNRRAWRWERASWPVWTFTAATPLAFALGLHGIAWCLPAVIFGLRIAQNRKAVIPRSTLLLILFLGWFLLSAVMIGPGSLPVFGYRFSLFLGAFTVVVWLSSTDETTVPTERIVNLLAALWVCLIGFGLIAQFIPTFAGRSPFNMALGPVGRIDFVQLITNWKIADKVTLVSFEVARPAAPFSATNSWGSAVGILTPFFIRSWLVGTTGRRRRAGTALLALSVIPILTSVNRGLWISLGLAFVYFAARKALRAKFGPAAVLAVAMAGVAVAFVATPMGSVVEDRLESADGSTESRGRLYEMAWEGAKESPLVGHAVPAASGLYPGSPPVGTHGMIWYLMFCHGFVGLGLFVGWLLTELVRSGRVNNPAGWWSHLAIVIAFVQLPYYGMLPHVILVGLAAGISRRDAAAERSASAPAPDSPGHRSTMPRPQRT